MSEQTKTKQLMKILVGAAWIDGVIQAEEREYLQKKVQENQLQDDPEIKSLLSEIKPVTPQECYQLLADYLGQNPTTQDYENLLEAISALVYSDGDIDIQEARLLSRLEDFGSEAQSSQSMIDNILKTIRKLYQKAIANT
jgi:uncharacterized membrane protein YebE (DUF533 family)